MPVFNAVRGVKHVLRDAPSIVGLTVKLPSPCRCGSHLATIAIGHVLQCECGARRNPLTERTVNFITAVAHTFGMPADPIILRRGDQ
jgi:hypothetical protein